MKKLFALLLALAMMLSMVSFAAAEDVTIKFWFWADNDDYARTMQEMIADFNATNGKGITVVGEQQPWDGGAYSQNLLQAALGGGGCIVVEERREVGGEGALAVGLNLNTLCEVLLR